MKGRIHSFETMGTVDGPGMRFVVFMQGCALRCRYCHNPDTWDAAGGKEYTVEDVLTEIEPYLAYYRKSAGGVTCTGGEPTLQSPFVAELFQACKERWGLHTALDTSGFCDPSHADALLKATDLVLLDMKMADLEKHRALTSQPNDRILQFARHLSRIGKPMWIRHVLVPGRTDAPEDLLALGRLIGEWDGIEKVEVLPFHQMGMYKWEQLGRKYELEGCRTPSSAEVHEASRLIRNGMLQSRPAGEAGRPPMKPAFRFRPVAGPLPAARP